MMMNDQYVTAMQIAEMLNLSRGSVYTMRKKGILPEGKKIGGVRRWNMAELQSFLKN